LKEDINTKRRTLNPQVKNENMSTQPSLTSNQGKIEDHYEFGAKIGK
jgi:hypothetical protein